jgi:hypothetical protein
LGDDTVIKSIRTVPSAYWDGREQGPYLDDWGCSSEEFEAKVKELGLESVAQVVSLDACRNTKWPKLNDTGMILFGGNTEYHFHGLGVDLDHKVFALIGCNDVFALNSSWLSSESLDISPEMEDQVDDECGALLVLFWKRWGSVEDSRTRSGGYYYCRMPGLLFGQQAWSKCVQNLGKVPAGG